jgi:hypothetical protein
LPYGTPQGFPVADLLSGILDHSLARRDHLPGEHAKPVNRRTANVKLKTRKLLANARNDAPHRHLNTSWEGLLSFCV